MRQFIYRSLVFLRLVDSFDSNLSLTNLALFIALYKLITTPAASLNDVGMVLISILNYGYKKYLNKDAAASDKEQ